MGASSFVTRCDQGGDKRLDHIVTGDGTRVSYQTPGTTRQSMERYNSNSPTKPKKTNQAALSAWKEALKHGNDRVLEPKWYHTGWRHFCSIGSDTPYKRNGPVY